MMPVEGVTFDRVEFIRAIDGDTVVVRPRGFTSEVHVRLLDAWCPELWRGSEASRIKGREAKAFTQSRCEANREHLALHVPFPAGAKGIWNGLVKAMTMGRVVGTIWLTETTTLADALVKHGHATREKAKRPAEGEGND